MITRPTPANLERMVMWLREHDAHAALSPAKSFDDTHAASLRGGANATLLTDLGQVDIVQRLPGLAPWDRLEAQAERYDLDGLSVKTVARNTLRQRKELRATAQDLADVAALERLQASSRE